MKNFLNVAAGLAVGALAMYYLDSASGRRRRALLRDKVVGVSHDAADLLQAKGKRAFDHVKGVLATRSLARVSSREPQSDAQLHDRVRSRLGRLVSHPKAIEVAVSSGMVRLSGHVLSRELDGLLSHVSHVAGVHKVHNALTAHDHPSEIEKLQGRQTAAQVEQPQAFSH